MQDATLESKMGKKRPQRMWLKHAQCSCRELFRTKGKPAWIPTYEKPWRRGAPTQRVPRGTLPLNDIDCIFYKIHQVNITCRSCSAIKRDRHAWKDTGRMTHVILEVLKEQITFLHCILNGDTLTRQHKRSARPEGNKLFLLDLTPWPNISRKSLSNTTMTNILTLT